MKMVRSFVAVILLAVSGGVGVAQAGAPTPKGYLIGEITVTDAATYKEYAAATGPLVTKYGGTYLVRGGQTMGLEGATVTGRVVVIEFKSLAAAKAFEDSAEYQKVAPLRRKASTGRLFLVEGAGL